MGKNGRFRRLLLKVCYQNQSGPMGGVVALLLLCFCGAARAMWAGRLLNGGGLVDWRCRSGRVGQLFGGEEGGAGKRLRVRPGKAGLPQPRRHIGGGAGVALALAG